MAKSLFSIKLLLETIFKILNKSTSYFADVYLLKDVSLVSKWKNGKVIPKNEDIAKIVEFVNSESTGLQRQLIRSKVDDYISKSYLDISFKNMLLGIEDLSSFLTEAFVASVSDAYKNNETETSEDSTVKEKLVRHEENKRSCALPNYFGIQRVSRESSFQFNKSITTKSIFFLVVLCITFFACQQSASFKKSTNSVHMENIDLNLTPEQNTIQLSDKYFLSYSYTGDSTNKVMVDINGITLNFSTSPLLLQNVLYLPLGETLGDMGYSFIKYDDSCQTFKDMVTGKTVVSTINSKKLQIDNKTVRLADSIKMEGNSVYVPAYSLKCGFSKYLDRMIPQNIAIQIENKSQTEYRYPPRIVDGILYLPFRDLFSTFFFDVKYEKTSNSTGRVTAVKDTKTVTVELSKQYAMVNGEPIQLSAPAFMSDDTTYVPADIIKNVLEMQYNWDSKKRILKISNDM